MSAGVGPPHLETPMRITKRKQGGDRERKQGGKQPTKGRKYDGDATDYGEPDTLRTNPCFTDYGELDTLRTAEIRIRCREKTGCWWRRRGPALVPFESRGKVKLGRGDATLLLRKVLCVEMDCGSPEPGVLLPRMRRSERMRAAIPPCFPP